MKNYLAGILISIVAHTGVVLAVLGLVAENTPAVGDAIIINLWSNAFPGNGAGLNDSAVVSSNLEISGSGSAPESALPLAQIQDFSQASKPAASPEALVHELAKPAESAEFVEPVLRYDDTQAPVQIMEQTLSQASNQVPNQVPNQVLTQIIGSNTTLVNLGQADPVWPAPERDLPESTGSGAGQVVGFAPGSSEATAVANGGGSPLQVFAGQAVGVNFGAINRQIRDNLVYPAQARRAGQSGIVILEFTILLDGHASEIRVVDSSGYNILDNGAVSAVERASPFPPPPESARIMVPVEFKLSRGM